MSPSGSCAEFIRSTRCNRHFRTQPPRCSSKSGGPAHAESVWTPGRFDARMATLYWFRVIDQRTRTSSIVFGSIALSPAFCYVYPRRTPASAAHRLHAKCTRPRVCEWSCAGAVDPCATVRRRKRRCDRSRVKAASFGCRRRSWRTGNPAVLPTSIRMTIDMTTKSRRRSRHCAQTTFRFYPAVVTMTSRPTRWAAQSRLILCAVLMIRPDPGPIPTSAQYRTAPDSNSTPPATTPACR
ncbi:hypothetical protein QFZ94_005165 [Paraburkholderia sp. JPY465]